MSRVALLDVNLLVALFDPDHVHHEIAHDWFADNRASGWATCPLTKNGFLRVLGNPARGGEITGVRELVLRLKKFCASGHHQFWPDSISLCDERLFLRSTSDRFPLTLTPRRALQHCARPVADVAEYSGKRARCVAERDLRVEKTFTVGDYGRVGFFADVLNLTNQGIPDPSVRRPVVTFSGPSFGLPQFWVPPRTVRAAARVFF